MYPLIEQIPYEAVIPTEKQLPLFFYTISNLLPNQSARLVCRIMLIRSTGLTSVETIFEFYAMVARLERLFSIVTKRY